MTERPAASPDLAAAHDDDPPIVVAAQHTDLVGVTTVSGNAPLADVTRNALAITGLFGLDVPVHAGCDRPLVAPARHAAEVHGATGLGGTSLPEPTRRAGTAHAVEYLLEATRARPGCWLVPVGPLTNIALALRLDPGLLDRIAGISLMGGGATTGNVTATAEFNVWADPEAAAIVFEAGARVPLRMAGLDVTHQVRMHGEDGDRLRATGTARGAFLADVLAYYGRSGRGGDRAPPGTPTHDPLAGLAHPHPPRFTHARPPVHVELAGTTRGMTVVDTRPHAPTDAATCDVAEAVDADVLRRLILDTLLAACA